MSSSSDAHLRTLDGRQVFLEGRLYRVVNGVPELVEEDPNDNRARLKVTPQAGAALKRARTIATGALGWRPQIEDVASALIETCSDESTVPLAMQRWLAMLKARRQATGR